MLLEHPEVATRPCERCMAFMYDPNGKQIKVNGEPMKRPAGTLPPCWDCPKKSPEHAHEFELSTANQRLLGYFLQARACGWNVPMDDLTRERFGVIDVILRAFEQQSLAAQFAGTLVPFVSGKR